MIGGNFDTCVAIFGLKLCIFTGLSIRFVDFVCTSSVGEGEEFEMVSKCVFLEFVGIADFKSVCCRGDSRDAFGELTISIFLTSTVFVDVSAFSKDNKSSLGLVGTDL